MDKKINILIVVMVLVLSLSIAYMFLSINMQENKNPPAINITNNETNNAETIDQSYYETDYSSDPMDADTEWYLDERPHKQMHSMDEVPVVKGKFIIQKMAADGMNIMIK